MAAFNPPPLSGGSQGGNSQDMKKIYSYVRLLNQQLQYCFSNIDPADNFSLEAMIRYNETDESISQLEITMDHFIAEFTSKVDDTMAAIKVMEGNITLKVSADELCSEISMSPDRIEFHTGQLVIDSSNFKLYEDGTAEFSGNISGGSININNRFVVNNNGGATLASSTFTESITCNGLLQTQELHVSGDAYIAAMLSCDRLNVSGSVSCDTLYERSDKRLKEDIREIPDEEALSVVLSLRPSVFRFKGSGDLSMGFIAQEVEEARERLGTGLPLTLRDGEYYSVPYGSYGALYAGAIRRQAKQIGELEALLREGQE